MNHKLSVLICDKLLKYKIIAEELVDVYIYGFELIFSFLISTLSIIAIGLIINQISPTLIFLTFFILIRRYTGGFHANTYLKCQIYTISLYLFVIIASILTSVNNIVYLIFILAGLSIIATIGPIDNPHKPLDEQEKRKHKKTGLLLFFSTGLIGYIFNYYHVIISNTIFFTLVVIITLMLIPYFNNKFQVIINSNTPEH